jgi:hypothetical protein
MRAGQVNAQGSRLRRAKASADRTCAGLDALEGTAPHASDPGTRVILEFKVDRMKEIRFDPCITTALSLAERTLVLCLERVLFDTQAPRTSPSR